MDTKKKQLVYSLEKLYICSYFCNTVSCQNYMQNILGDWNSKVNKWIDWKMIILKKNDFGLN